MFSGIFPRKMCRSQRGSSSFLPDPQAICIPPLLPNWLHVPEQPSMHAEAPQSCVPALRSAQRCCCFGDFVVPWQDEVAQTPTGYESLWYDTFSGSHAAASEKRQYNWSYASSKYKA